MALHPADAEALGAEENSALEVSLAGETVLLPLRCRADLPRGSVGLAVGVPGSPWFSPGATVTLRRRIRDMSGWTSSLTAALVGGVKAVVLLLGLVSVAAMLIWVERRLLALWQDRYGPNRVGPFGLLQVIADMIKIFFKEDWVPGFVDRPVFLLAPLVAMSTALLIFVVIPVAPGWGVAPDLNVGVLLFLALAELQVYGAMLGGWSSNSKYALLGGLRSAAQMLSYEVFMGIALMGVVIQAGSFRLDRIVEAQSHLWFIVPQCCGFFAFSLAARGERAPLSIRPAGDRAGTRRRLSHRVLGHEVRHVLRRRVRGHRAWSPRSSRRSSWAAGMARSPSGCPGWVSSGLRSRPCSSS